MTVRSTTNVPNAIRATNVPKATDEGAGAGAAGGVAFGDQLIAGLEDGVARDAEVAGEGATAGESLAGAEPARQDRSAQRTV